MNLLHRHNVVHVGTGYRPTSRKKTRHDTTMTIYYSLIARGATKLCSHQEGAGNFDQIVESMLPNIPTRNDARTTYTTNNDFMFHVMIENGVIYLCATDPECSKLTAYSFLNEIRSTFMSGSLAQRAHFAGENELQRDFTPVLQMKMEKYSATDVVINDGGGPLSKLQAQVNEVKDVMTQNIEKVLERGERLEDLVDKTEDLEASANTFRTTSTRVHRVMWWKNMKMKIIIGAVVFALILIILLIILFKTGVLPVKHQDHVTTTTTTSTTTPFTTTTVAAAV